MTRVKYIHIKQRSNMYQHRKTIFQVSYHFHWDWITPSESFHSQKLQTVSGYFVCNFIFFDHEKIWKLFKIWISQINENNEYYRVKSLCILFISFLLYLETAPRRSWRPCESNYRGAMTSCEWHLLPLFFKPSDRSVWVMIYVHISGQKPW